MPVTFSNDSTQTATDISDDGQDFDATLFAALLVDEQPSIDAALKSYASFIAAQQPPLANQADDDKAVTWTLSEVLAMTRRLSQTINQHAFAIQRVETERYSVTAKVWNNVAAVPEQKPTKLLGRTSLRMAWPDLDLDWTTPSTAAALADAAYSGGHGTGENDTAEDAATLLAQKTSFFVQFFGELVRAGQESPNARLIWDSTKELQRRAAERYKRAAAQAVVQQERQQQQQATEQKAVVEVDELAVVNESTDDS
jgi:hypothetical protein